VSKAIIYIRVSTDDQETANQLPGLIGLASDLKCADYEIFAENESAWKAGHQSELKRALDCIRKGQRRYDYLLVWALDRLSREGPVRVMSLVAELEKHQCQVVSLKERAFTDLPKGVKDLMIMLMAWIAEQESIRRSERTKAGLARAVTQGKRLGWPQGAKDKNGKRRKSGYYLRWADKQTSGKNAGDIVRGNMPDQVG